MDYRTAASGVSDYLIETRRRIHRRPELSGQEAETAALVSCRRRAKCIIDSVPDPNQRDVLTYRYLNGYGWDTVALLMDRSRTQVWRIHSAALESAQRIYDVFDMETFLKKIFSEDAEKRKTEWNETLDL